MTSVFQPSPISPKISATNVAKVVSVV